MWAWLWQQIPDGDSALSKSDRIVIAGMVAAVLTPTWLTWWKARVVKKQVLPNSGTSLADKLTRIETQNDRIETKVDVHTMSLDAQRDEMASVKTGLANHREEVNKIVRELRHDIDGIASDVHELQQAQSQRRETINQEEGTSQ